MAPISEVEQEYTDTIELLYERLSELELAMEDVGWLRLGAEAEREFSRDGLRRIAAMSRLAFIKNPLIQRAVALQALYVWGQGVTIQARHPALDAVVQAFLDDKKNRAELTSHQARTFKELDLQVDGNLFFVFFPNAVTGRVRVRTIAPDEIVEIVCNPEDAKEPWYYRRTWNERRLDVATGQTVPLRRIAYYPDWQYNPLAKPQHIGEHSVEWASPVYHVKVGGLSDMRFGVPETYAALDWARAYKSFLEDVATVMRAVSRFSAKVTTKGGSRGIAAAKQKLSTTLAAGGSGSETNPPPVAGSVFVAGEGTDFTPLNVRGVTIAPEDGRRFLLMVCAAMGIPETFTGDVSVGTLATAKSLDRPTELKYVDRRTLWGDVLGAILGYAIDWAARAPRGALQGLATVTTDDDGELVVRFGDDPETQQPLDRGVAIAFPSILEHSVTEQVDAIVKAATLGAPGTLAGTLDLKLLTRLLLTALGVEHVDELLAQLFPEDEAAAGDPTPPENPAPPPDPEPASEEA